MKYSVKFQLSTREGMNAQSVPIRLRVCYSGYRIDIHSGYVIDANKWDKESQRVTLGSKNCYKQTSGEINRGLSNMVSKVEEVLTRFELEHHRTPTPKEFKPLFYASIGRHVIDEKKKPSNNRRASSRSLIGSLPKWVLRIIGRKQPILNLQVSNIT